MVALGGAIAIAGVLLREQIASYPPLADVLVGLTTLALLAAGVFLVIPGTSVPAVLTATAAAGVFAVTVGRVTQARLGPGVAVAGGLALVVGLAAVIRPLSTAVLAPLAGLSEPWTLDPRVRADLRLVPDGSVLIEGAGWALAVIGLWWLAGVLASAGRRPRPLVPDVLVVASVFAAVAVVCLAPIASHRAVGAVFVATLGAALVLTAVGGVVHALKRRVAVLLAAAAVAAIPAFGWGATNRWTTVNGLCAALLVFALVAGRTRHPLLRTFAIGGVGLCVVVAAATWSLAVGAAVTTTGVVLAVVVSRSGSSPRRIAEFQLDALRLVYDERPSGTDYPPIPVQAAFEGALYAACTSLELTGTAIRKALDLKLRDDESLPSRAQCGYRAAPGRSFPGRSALACYERHRH